MTPITASEASFTSVLSNSLGVDEDPAEPPSDAASIAAPTTAIDARRKA